MGELRYEKLKGVKASVAPILWQYGAISRLNPNDDIIDEIDRKGFTVTLGYSGLYETVKVLTGESHTTEKGHELALKIMCYLESKCKQWKEIENIDLQKFGFTNLYGRMFYNTNLKDVVIPEGVISLGNAVFSIRRCSLLIRRRIGNILNLRPCRIRCIAADFK